MNYDNVNFQMIKTFYVEEFLDSQDFDTDFILELSQAFHRSYSNYLQRFVTNIADDDIEGFKKTVHGLKGSLNVFYAKPTIDICKQIEDILKIDNSFSSIMLLFNKLKSELDLLLNDVDLFVSLIGANEK